MTGYERTGWRDQELSARHRRWGFNCPAVDLDFLMVEYNLGVPVAVVDYKHHKFGRPDDLELEHPNFQASGALYDYRYKLLPLLVARYWPQTWAFEVKPVNKTAQEWLPQCDWVPMTERQFIGGLYKMRELVVEECILRNLNNHLPPDEAGEQWPA